MRVQPITLPAVAALLVGAALVLLSGCVGEGGLEPIGELLEVGPELPEGVSAGPDGSITIGKGLAIPEGFALGEEDWRGLAFGEDDFECRSLWECFRKCPWGSLCVCEWDGERWQCVVVSSEDFCKWFKHGCGEGSGEGDWKDEVSLYCLASVMRGSTATCEIRTGQVNPNLLHVHYWGSDVDGFQYGGMTWGGVATRTAMIKVSLSMELLGESVTLEQTVDVMLRTWEILPQKNARADTQWVNVIPGGAGRGMYGLYQGAEPAGLSAEPGGGPWEYSYYVSGTPYITAAAMYLHNDLKPGGPAYPIPAADTICGVSGLSVSVYSLNDTCGYKSRVDAFRDEVVAHEFEHEESLNKCIERVNRRLGDIEEIVGYLDGVDGNIFTLWTYPLLKAAETAQDAMLASIWEYRPGPWSYLVVTNPHGGTDGCPQI